MKVSFIIPVYNEENVVSIFYNKLMEHSNLNVHELELLFIDDGSTDGTLSILKEMCVIDSRVKVISFTKNFGKEAALRAGFDYCSGDAVIPIDVDLQDPLDIVEDMIDRWKNGADIVLAKRVDRSSDTIFKRITAKLFYKVYNMISYQHIEENVGDFRLLDRKVVENIKLLNEKNLFMKGILSWVGGSEIAVIEYTRADRIGGKSKFNFCKLYDLAMNGVTSFSTVPLRIWMPIGIVLLLFSFISMLINISCYLFLNTSTYINSVFICLLFLSGIHLIALGIIGEYLHTVLVEIKNRPIYIIKSRFNV